MITIQKITRRRNSKVRVTFAMPAIEGCGCLYLVGKFDEWDESVYRMHCVDDGSWSLTLELEPDRLYSYRFRTHDGRWLRDQEEDVPFAPNVSKFENSGVSSSAMTFPLA